MTMWQPGMRCVCVDDNWTEFWDPASASVPQLHRVYTVDGVDRDDIYHSHAGLSFAEAEVSLDWWCSSQFRPLSETRLDQFKAHLVTPPREKVGA